MLLLVSLMVFVFSYLGTVLPIWRFAQPTNYIGFWVTLLTIGFSALGAIVGGVRALFGNPDMIAAVIGDMARAMPLTRGMTASRMYQYGVWTSSTWR